MKCNECGVELDPSQEQVNAAVHQVLENSLQSTQKTVGVCPLCGHSRAVPYSQHNFVFFAVLIACAVILGLGAFRQWRQTERSRIERSVVVDTALARLSNDADATRLIGTPISVDSGVVGEIRSDNWGWIEARFTIPVHGPNGSAQVGVIAGKGEESWVFTTFEVVFTKRHQKLDLISGTIVDYEPNASVNVHTELAGSPEFLGGAVPAPHFDGNYPCVFASIEGRNISSQLGQCAMPTTHAKPVDRFEADFRDGNFVMRETDLSLHDVFDVPLTRSYRSNDWLGSNPVHAFGRNSNHPYDIAPTGTTNPYTFQMLHLEDGEFIFFDRISKGTGYADAVYQHSETSTRFYKATQRWNGNGWTMKLADGSEILFPESYRAKNMAQGAPMEMRDASGNLLKLIRDPQRNLQEIRTPQGHWIKFSYDNSSRVKRAEDDAGNWAQYEYNSEGMLVTVNLSSGRQRHYSYHGTSMTQVTDESGHMLVHNTYTLGILSEQEFGNHQVYLYRYDWPLRRYYPEKVIVTLPDQTTREISVAGSVSDSARTFHRD